MYILQIIWSEEFYIYMTWSGGLYKMCDVSIDLFV